MRRVLRRLVPDEALHDDLCQEVLVRLIAAADRLDRSTGLTAYAMATTHNVVRSYQRDEGNRARKLAQAAAIEARSSPPADDATGEVDASAVRLALEQLNAADRQLLERDATGQRLGAMPGALRVRLVRARARARVQYVVASRRTPPPSDRCLRILGALAAGDRARQGSLGVDSHLAGCPFCASLAGEVSQREGCC